MTEIKKYRCINNAGYEDKLGLWEIVEGVEIEGVFVGIPYLIVLTQDKTRATSQYHEYECKSLIKSEEFKGRILTVAHLRRFEEIKEK